MLKPVIKVGFCVAYDWEMLKKSLPRVYEFADTICLSIDIDRRSWSGKLYEFDNEAFGKFVEDIDISKKIRIYEGAFSLPELSPMENDNRQRNMMSVFMGQGGWHIQVDCDEYFLDFKGFTNYLKKMNPHPTPLHKPININVNLIPLIKKTFNGYIFVDFGTKTCENAPFATNLPIYEGARRNGHFNHVSPFFAIHETWARSKNELWGKLQNWGHRDDFNKDSYYKLWLSLDEYNYQYIYNFHPTQPSAWPKLAFSHGIDIEAFIENLHSLKTPLLKWKLSLRNNRNLARLKNIYSKY